MTIGPLHYESNKELAQAINDILRQLDPEQLRAALGKADIDQSVRDYLYQTYFGEGAGEPPSEITCSHLKEFFRAVRYSLPEIALDPAKCDVLDLVREWVDCGDLIQKVKGNVSEMLPHEVQRSHNSTTTFATSRSRLSDLNLTGRVKSRMHLQRL
jgi:hypothetical protein